VFSFLAKAYLAQAKAEFEKKWEATPAVGDCVTVIF
jgi:hypothetical protein